MSGIKLLEVRVRNFRSLREVDVSLDDLTVLIGENNSGKTSFLDALCLAVGAGKRVALAEDIFMSLEDRNVPRERAIVIDVLIRPTDEHGRVIERFPEGSYWLALWGRGVSQDETDNDFVGIRTEVKWNAARAEYLLERRFLAEWPADPQNWETAKVKERAASVLARHIEPVAVYYMDAKRDIYDDMQSRGSFWHRLVSDSDLAEADIERLEEQLNAVNEQIISASDVLHHVQAGLDELCETVDSPSGSVSITPTARTLRDLGRGMDVHFATRGAQPFPLAKHGMGTRSLAALLTFRAYVTWRQKKWAEASTEGQSLHPVLALEEPEAHLHPQAQGALSRLIRDIPGQRILSTHSPYIVREAKVSQLRHFGRSGSVTTVTRVNANAISEEDERKLDRMVIHTRGDMLYARAVILCSGETEEQALSVFAEAYFGRAPAQMGISILGVGGDGSYLPFIRVPHSFGVPWYIFSDAEPSAVDAVRRALEELGEPYPSPRVHFLPGGMNYEQFLASVHEYRQILIGVIVGLSARSPQHERTLSRKWAAKTEVERDLARELAQSKTKYAVPAAVAITQKAADTFKVPPPVRGLFEAAGKELGIRGE